MKEMGLFIVILEAMVVEIVMETQSSENRKCQTWWLVGLIVNSRLVE
jgi:hypothetical protein